jgi:hypothetical protein
MPARLDEIETDLIARRARAGAEAEGWLGEIEGTDLTVTCLRGKREQARGPVLVTGPGVDLGMPSVPRQRP